MCCGAKVIGTNRFCTECGSPLEGAASKTPVPAKEQSPTVPCGAFPPGGISGVLGKSAAPDPSLTMLAEYIERTQGTCGSDGYSEWVLNRRPDGKLQTDYYNNRMGYREEIHRMSPVPEDLWNRILEVKKRYCLTEASGAGSNGMPGGSRTVKIVENGTVIRLTCGFLTAEENQAFTLIRELLTGTAREED